MVIPALEAIQAWTTCAKRCATELAPNGRRSRLLDRATEMFLPVVNATAYLGDQPVAPEMDAILVNRFYLRGIERCSLVESHQTSAPRRRQDEWRAGRRLRRFRLRP